LERKGKYKSLSKPRLNRLKKLNEKYERILLLPQRAQKEKKAEMGLVAPRKLPATTNIGRAVRCWIINEGQRELVGQLQHGQCFRHFRGDCT
jgi:hypothetical protein